MKVTEKELTNLLFDEKGLDVYDYNYDDFHENLIKPEHKTSNKEVERLADVFIERPTDRNFKRLWDAAYWGIRQHAYKIIPDNSAVDDIIADVFEKILTKHNQFDRSKGKFTTWMFKICWNECLAYINKKKKDSYVDNDIENLYPSFQVEQIANKFIDDYDFSDKFETIGNAEVRMMSREDVKKKFLDTSINEIEHFKDERIVTCMKERFTFYDTDAGKKNLTLEEIAAKYNYPITSVKNWINKGRKELKDTMIKKHRELYEMWRETLD